MDNSESNIHFEDQRHFADIPRAYKDIPSLVLREILEELTLLTAAFDRFESKAESKLSKDYVRGMKALDLCLKNHHEKLIAKASIQILAELTLRVHLNGNNALQFINDYALENITVISGFDTSSVLFLASVWEKQSKQ